MYVLPPKLGLQAISITQPPCLHGPPLMPSLVMLQSQTIVHRMCVSAKLSKKTRMPSGIQKQHCRYDKCTQLAMQQVCCTVSILLMLMFHDPDVLVPQDSVILFPEGAFHVSSSALSAPVELLSFLFALTGDDIVMLQDTCR